MLPGMKISLWFCRMANTRKPRVVTDHSASELNAEISREDAKVRYDDMRWTFGQSLHDTRLANVGRQLILYKDDVASAFLNLPAHLFGRFDRCGHGYDGRLHDCRRLVFGNRAFTRVWCIFPVIMLELQYEFLHPGPSRLHTTFFAYLTASSEWHMFVMIQPTERQVGLGAQQPTGQTSSFWEYIFLAPL